MAAKSTKLALLDTYKYLHTWVYSSVVNHYFSGFTSLSLILLCKFQEHVVGKAFIDQRSTKQPVREWRDVPPGITQDHTARNGGEPVIVACSAGFRNGIRILLAPFMNRNFPLDANVLVEEIRDAADPAHSDGIVRGWDDHAVWQRRIHRSMGREVTVTRKDGPP